MANSDDPPFLNVGTEVSAKYRGAFCEATIKVAKKLVKCKISYTHGPTEVVHNDIIKGPLKVNASVEVRQSDGQYLAGILLRLVDASTYTVVFDDGDEKTLKRSSLCLKGGRHYSASESLDQMPLTDPENFGTPVHYQTKRGNRRRQHPSSSPDPVEVLSPPKKPAVIIQSTEFPVGRCVFLENDRRRSSWLPAVVVPHHYVMEDSEVTKDTICIRSFKDGRFFAAKVDELHSFSPDKEPLSSMLEGEVQPMYMCKPAIERAMAYLDTGDLPWDMDLLDSKETVHKDTDQQSTVDQSAEKDSFYERLKKFQEEKGITLPHQPLIAHQELDLFKLYRLVRDNGGMERVTQEFKWRSLYLQLGLPPATNSSHMIKQAYKRYLNAFETYERAKEEGKNPVIKNTRKRPAIPDSDDDIDKTLAVKQEKLDDTTITTTTTTTTTTNTTNSNSSETIPLLSSVSQGEPTMSACTEKSSVGGAESRGGEAVGETIKANDRIKVSYGRGKAIQTYEAKVLEVDESRVLYYVHYNGWNTRYDEWIDGDRIVEKVTMPSKGLVRPPYKKKQVKVKSKLKENGHSPSANSKQSPATASLETTPVSDTTPLTTPTTNNTLPKITKGGKGGQTPARRRTSSTTETSSSCDVPSSPLIPQQPTTTSSSSSNNKKPVISPSSLHPSPPPSPTSPSLHCTSSPGTSSSQLPHTIDQSHTTGPTPLKVESDASSEDEHSFDIKKEENADWLDLESEQGSVGDTTNHPDTSIPSSPPSSHPITTNITTNITTTNTTTVQPNILPAHTISTDSSLSVATIDNKLNSPSVDKSQVNDISLEENIKPLPSQSTTITTTTTTTTTTTNGCVSPGKVSSSSSSCSSSHRKNDSGVENSSESSDGGGGGDGGDEPKTGDKVEDLDFSIDMTLYTHLSPLEKITLIQERMKAIQQKYMELKSEVTYLDRKKRKARKKEREVARLLASKEENNELSIPSTATPPLVPLPPSLSFSVAVESS